MAVRIMNYLGLLYQDLIRRGECCRPALEPPMLPIVLYSGASAWRAATDIAELIPKAPGLVAQHLPSCNIC